MPLLDGDLSRSFTAHDVVDALARAATALEKQAETLNMADRELGDGDLGITLREAFQLLASRVAEPAVDVGATLLACAKVLSASTGSSFGTLLATGFMAAGALARGRAAVEWTELSDLLAAARDKMAQRGRSQLGDKTVLDALEAARLAVATVTESDETPALKADVLNAIDAELTRLRDQPCRQGRARIYADKSRGLDDPGMLAFRALAAAV